MKEVIKFLIGKFDYIKTEVLIGVLSAALIGIISRGVNCIRNVWKQNKKIKISQVFSAYAEVEQLPIVTEVKEKNNVGDVSDNIYYKKSFLKAIIENTSTRDVPIKKTWIVFDEAKKSEVRELAVLAHLYKGKFVIYVVNNGFTNITNVKINLEGNIDTDMSIKRGEKVTLSATLLFSPYPQAYFPQLCITAIVIPGRTIGSLGDMGERFSDNQRIEGTIPEMLDEALLFVKRNMRTKTIISPTTGRRTDRTDYPITAVREAIINALVHRDYSIHTEGMPIQLIMFEDRIEIHNPGGLYGRITIDQLGKIQPDTRNPVLASALETLGIIENRYSGIPTIRMEMEKYNLRQPEFLDERGSFIVKLYKESKNDYEDMSNDEETNNLIVFCKTPRTRKEICDYLGLNSVTYAIQTYVNPLVEAGVIKLSIPDKPKSPKQLYYSVEREE